MVDKLLLNIGIGAATSIWALTHMIMSLRGQNIWRKSSSFPLARWNGATLAWVVLKKFWQPQFMHALHWRQRLARIPLLLQARECTMPISSVPSLWDSNVLWSRWTGWLVWTFILASVLGEIGWHSWDCYCNLQNNCSWRAWSNQPDWQANEGASRKVLPPCQCCLVWFHHTNSWLGGSWPQTSFSQGCW